MHLRKKFGIKKRKEGNGSLGYRSSFIRSLGLPRTKLGVERKETEWGEMWRSNDFVE